MIRHSISLSALCLTALLFACSPIPVPTPTPTPTPNPTPTPTPGPSGTYTAERPALPAGVTRSVALALNNKGDVLLVGYQASSTAGYPYLVGNALKAITLPGKSAFVNGFAIQGRACLSDDGRAAFNPNVDSAGFGSGLQTMYYDGGMVTPIPFVDQDSDPANGNSDFVQGCSQDMVVAGSNATGGVYRWQPGQAATIVDESPFSRAFDGSAGGIISAFKLYQGNQVTAAPAGMALYAINEAGLIAGTFVIEGTTYPLGLWTPGSAPKRIDAPAGKKVTGVLDLNSKGEVLVALSAADFSSTSYAVYTGGTFRALEASGWTLARPVALNDQGWVLADARDSAGTSGATIYKPN